MEREHRLKVTFRRVQSERGAEGRVLAVFCPRRTEAIDLRECQDCPHCQGLCVDPTDRETFLRCGWSAQAIPPQSPLRAPATPAREAPLAAVMSAPARCVRPELPLTELVRLFVEEAISGVPVVDDAGMPVGLVSKSDVVRHYAGADGERAEAREAALGSILSAALDLAGGRLGETANVPTVGDVMTHVVFTLHAEASLSRAAALMAFEGVHRIVVVGPDGRATGMVSSLDILRWIARQDGYVVPAPPPRSAPPPREGTP